MLKRTKLFFTVPQEYDGALLKSYLRKHCGVSAQLMTDLKKEYTGICVNGFHRDVIDKIAVDDMVELTLPTDKNNIEPIKFPLDIIFEDEHIIVLNKPVNMPVHPTSCGHYNDTLANAVTYYMYQQNEKYAVRAINRLDRDTSGLVIIAKNSYSAYNLGTKAEKTYYAVCEGKIESHGTVDIGIKREEGRSIQRIASKQGQTAITHYMPIEYKNGHTLVKLKLETGRTHQIRVHMSYIGHPLAGDDMYGGSLTYIGRQALHCGRVVFCHPITKEKLDLTAKLPEDMQSFRFNMI